MRILAFLLSLSWCAGAASAPDLDALVAATRTAPAEFAADVLIRLAALDRVDQSRKIELLDQAFHRAASATQPYKRRSVILRVGSFGPYFNRVYSQDLDALSLRLRAVEALLPLDSRKARELFLQIPPLRLTPLTCADFLAYDPSRFYQVLGELLRRSFTDEETAHGEPAKLLARYAGAFASPVEIAPLAHVLAGAGLSDSEFRSLLASFTAALAKVAGDDRSFTASASVGKEILALVDEAKRRQVSPLPLIESYRVYLVVNLSAVRCADNDLLQPAGQSFGLVTGQPADSPATDRIAFFNGKIRIAPLQPIQESESQPARIEGAVTGLLSCQDEDCRAIAKQFRGLVFGPTGAVYQPAERAAPEWQAKLQAMLTSLADWRESSGNSSLELFREKSAVYAELLNLLPGGPERELVLHAILAHVAGNRVQNVNPVEWFLPVNALIGRTTLDPLGLAKFAEDLRRSSDRLVALYANLEAVAPRTPDRIVPLL